MNEQEIPPGEAVQPEVLEAASSDGDGTHEAPTESVTRPAKLIRIASMVRNMLEEVRRAPLDDAGRRLLRDLHSRSITELQGVMSPDLLEELTDVVLPFTSDTPSESELRIAQAQLVGWLEGLFHGIQATVFAQQVGGQQMQVEELRRRRELEATSRGASPDGPYL